MKPVASRSNSTERPTTLSNRWSRISTPLMTWLRWPAFFCSSLTRDWPTYQSSAVTSSNTTHTASLGSLRHLADGLGDAARDLVLALLRMALEDADVDERHGGLLPVKCEQLVAQRGVVSQLSRGPGEAHRAFLQNIHPVGERKREVDALLGQQDGEALPLQLADALEQLVDHQRRQALRRARRAAAARG